MATEVGTAYVAILPSAKGFARSLQKEIAKEFAGTKLDQLIAEQLGGTQVKLPVEPVLTKDSLDTSELRDPVTLPVEVDAREAAQQVRQAARLAERTAPTIELNVDVDRHRFRSMLGRVFDGATTVITSLAENATKSLGQLASNFATNVATSLSTVATTGTATTVATGGLNLIAAALIAAAGAAAVALTGFVALAPAVLIAGGAFGSAATAAVGLGGAFAVLKFGMSGIGDALKEIGKDGKVSAETLEKLSPNARALVKEFERLKGPLDDLRRFVQDRLLEGMNREIRDLAAKWLPALKPILGSLADRFNDFARTVFDALGKPDFIANISEAMDGFGGFIDRIRQSMPGLIDAFGRLAAASAPFLEELGDIIGDLVDKFSDWIAAADKSGKLDQFMKDAAQALRDIWDIGGLVVGIIGDIIEILFPGSKRASDGILGSVKVLLQDIKAWLADPENQQKLRDFIDKIQDFIEKAATEWIPKTIEFMNKVDGWVKKVEGWGETITNWKNTVSTAFSLVAGVVSSAMSRARSAVSSLVSMMSGLPGRIRSAVGSLGNLLYSAGRSVIQGLISGIRSMFGGLESTLGWVTSRIPDWKGPADKDRQLLEPAGSLIMGGLIRGIRGELPALRSELAGVTDIVAGTPLGGTYGGQGLSAATPAPAVPAVAFVGDAPDSFMRWIRENTRIYYGGSAQAAIGT